MFHIQGTLDKSRFANLVPANHGDAYMREIRSGGRLDMI